MVLKQNRISNLVNALKAVSHRGRNKVSPAPTHPPDDSHPFPPTPSNKNKKEFNFDLKELKTRIEKKKQKKEMNKEKKQEEFDEKEFREVQKKFEKSLKGRRKGFRDEVIDEKPTFNKERRKGFRDDKI